MKKCPKCGCSNENQSEFCENCGQSLSNVRPTGDLLDTKNDALGDFIDKIGDIFAGPKRRINYSYNKQTTSYSTTATQQASKHSGQFINSDEAVRATLGVSIIQSFMSGAGFKHGAAVLTDKRLYYFGRSFSNVGKTATASTEEGIIPVDEISLTRFVHKSPLGWLILAVLSFALALSSTRNGGLFGVMLIAGVILLFLFLINRRTFLEIAFPGGRYYFDARWHSTADMRTFQQQIHLAKDRLKHGGNTDATEKAAGQ